VRYLLGIRHESLGLTDVSTPGGPHATLAIINGLPQSQEKMARTEEIASPMG